MRLFENGSLLSSTNGDNQRFQTELTLGKEVNYEGRFFAIFV